MLQGAVSEAAVYPLFSLDSLLWVQSLQTTSRKILQRKYCWRHGISIETVYSDERQQLCNQQKLVKLDVFCLTTRCVKNAASICATAFPWVHTTVPSEWRTSVYRWLYSFNKPAESALINWPTRLSAQKWVLNRRANAISCVPSCLSWPVVFENRVLSPWCWSVRHDDPIRRQDLRVSDERQTHVFIRIIACVWATRSLRKYLAIKFHGQSVDCLFSYGHWLFGKQCVLLSCMHGVDRMLLHQVQWPDECLLAL